MSKLADAFKKLGDVTPRLNSATDAANAAYRATEELLTKFGTGIDAEICVRELSDNTEQNEETGFLRGVVRKLFLVYDRIGAKYRLGFKVVIQRSICPDGNPNEWEHLGDEVEELQAWDQAGRHWKLAGVAVLADLIEAIGAEAEALSESAEAAAQTVNGILRDLEEMSAQAEHAKRNSMPPVAELVALQQRSRE